MQAVDVHAEARKLFAALGAKAIAEAAQRARTLEEQGKRDQAADWRRIEAAIAEMKGPRAS